MKILLDIPKETYHNLKMRGLFLNPNDREALEKAIRKSTQLIEAPITPLEPKTGHWKLADEQNKEDVENDNYRFICSECQCSDIHAKGTIVPYCWKCGAKMI